MERIHFLNTDAEQIIEAYRITSVNPSFSMEPNIIEIDFVENVPDVITNGFELINEFNGESMTGDYYFGYTTVYRKIDERSVMLSNDGSVYVEPEPEIPEDSLEGNNEESENTIEESVVDKSDGISEDSEGIIDGSNSVSKEDVNDETPESDNIIITDSNIGSENVENDAKDIEEKAEAENSQN